MRLGLGQAVTVKGPSHRGRSLPKSAASSSSLVRSSTCSCPFTSLAALTQRGRSAGKEATQTRQDVCPSSDNRDLHPLTPAPAHTCTRSHLHPHPKARTRRSAKMRMAIK